MPDSDGFGPNDLAVQAHLMMLQRVIDRMAANSAACKTWCVTLSAAVFIVAFARGVDLSPLIALIPIALLAYQDATYLSLERGVRRIYDEFVSKLHAGVVAADDLFLIRPAASLPERLRAVSSWSLVLFYPPLAAAAIGLHFV